MPIEPDEITAVIKRHIQSYSLDYKEEGFGTVLQVGDNIAQIHGLSDVKAGELLEFECGAFGMAMNLEEYSIGCIVLGGDMDIQEGQKVVRTKRIVQVPVGRQLLGRVINPLGQPMDGKGPIKSAKFRSIEAPSPSIVNRQPICESLNTGIKAVDALIPIGRGQRQMIIGDRQTGKTAIAVDTILNQKPGDVYCIYVAIGQKASSIASVIEILKQFDRLKNTIIIVASADEPPSILYIAPYAGCAVAEEFFYRGEDVLIIYDDLTKHANAYRELSLLLRRPAGREAYPGDVFYLHSRLLERSARLKDTLGGGSCTALPIVETQMGDISAYIPTNIISITDGQIYLDKELFNQGIRPAVDVGLSVSRVGGAAQTDAMKKTAGSLRLELAQFRELEAFTKFSSEELEKGCQIQIERGKRIVEVLKQKQYNPMTIPHQIAVLYCASKGQLDFVPLEKISDLTDPFLSFLAGNYPQYEEEINKTGGFTPKAEGFLLDAVQRFTKIYLTEHMDKEDVRLTQEESFKQRIWSEIAKNDIEAASLEEELNADLQMIKKETNGLKDIAENEE